MAAVKPKIKIKWSWNKRNVRIEILRKVEAPLKRASAMVRKDAVKSLKPYVSPKTARKNPSRPGEPPHSIRHKRNAAHRMKMILFAEQKPGTYVIGPKVLIGKGSHNPTPAVHEHGGYKTRTVSWIDARRIDRRPSTEKQRKAFQKKIISGEIQSVYIPAKDQLGEGHKRWQKKRKTVVIKYPQRPFMAPALRAIIPKLPDIFAKGMKK